jgi:hypothetical protein
MTQLMEYQTIYSILNDAPRVPWVHVFIGLIGGPAFIYASWKTRSWLFLVLGIVWAGFWNITILPASWAIYRDHEQSKAALRSGNCKAVEGTIEDFHPMPYTGHSYERFKIQGVSFEYSDFDDSKAGFNHTLSHGGPLHGGMHVRLHYRDGRILQIEVPNGFSAKTSLSSR